MCPLSFLNHRLNILSKVLIQYTQVLLIPFSKLFVRDDPLQPLLLFFFIPYPLHLTVCKERKNENLIFKLDSSIQISTLVLFVSAIYDVIKVGSTQ